MKTPSRRQEQVAKEIKEILSPFLIQKTKGLIEGIVSITRAEVTADLRLVSLHISLLTVGDGKDENFEQILDFEQEMQRELAHNMNTKFTPKIRIFQDRGMEQMQRISDQLKKY